MKKVVGVGRALFDGYVKDDMFFKYLERALNHIPAGNFSMEVGNDQAAYLAKQLGYEHLKPAGSSFNTISGCIDDFDTGFVCSVGDDIFGDVYIAELKRFGVSPLVTRSNEPTGLVLVVEGNDRRAALFSYGASSYVDPLSFQDSVVGSDILFAEGYIFMPPADVKLHSTFDLYSCRTRPGFKVVNLGGYSSPILRNRMLVLKDMVKMKSFDYVLGNEMESAEMARELGYDEGVLLGSRGHIVTMAEKGSIGLEDDSRYVCETEPISFGIKIGAGDAYAAGFLRGIGAEFGLKDCMRVATESALSHIRKLI